jgi:hypothetical protein
MDTRITLRQALLGALAVLALAATFTVGTLVSSSRTDTAAAATTTPATDATGTIPGITVTSTATVTGTPDTLRLSMSVSVSRSSVGDALAQANAAAAKVQASLRKSGVAAKDLQTSGMSIYPTYGSSGSSITGYQVSESLTAVLRHLDKAGSAISAAAAAGGNDVRIDTVSLDIEDTGALLATARTKAVGDARTKAEQYAQAAGRDLGALTSLSESVSTPSSPYYPAPMSADAAKSAVPIQAGSQHVQVSVTAVYALR